MRANDVNRFHGLSQYNSISSVTRCVRDVASCIITLIIIQSGN